MPIEVKVVRTQTKEGSSTNHEFIMRKHHVLNVIHITAYPIASSKKDLERRLGKNKFIPINLSMDNEEIVKVKYQ